MTTLYNTSNFLCIDGFLSCADHDFTILREVPDWTQNIGNGLLSGGGGFPRFGANAPAHYGDRQKQYFSGPTKAFVLEKARYASDFFTAKTIGLDPSDAQREITVRLRMANIVRPSAAIQRNFDDYKQILLEDPNYDYLRQGTKLYTMGSWWLSYNPDNISAVSGSGIIRRCNAIWNHLDPYGNILSEPICVEETHANANAPDSQQATVIAKGYFNVLCQYNDFTAQINDNTRLILGKRAYSVSGYNDFEQEFTGDYGSIRLLRFTVRAEEPNAQIDDMENHIAGGLTFSWEIALNGVQDLSTGDETIITARSYRNGTEVVSTAEMPITYQWSSSDDTVAAVDGNGIVRGISSGEATITAVLTQNPAITQSIRVFVEAGANQTVRFTSAVPTVLYAYGAEAKISAAYFTDGEPPDDSVTWKFSGPERNAYRARSDGNSVYLSCWAGSAVPLTVTAECKGAAISAVIRLEGI